MAFQASPGGLDERRSRKKFCRNCGAFCNDDLDQCPFCRTRFDGENSLVATVLDMPNVLIHRRERITSEEEERRRRGYDIEIFYQLVAESTGYRHQDADVFVDTIPVLRLIYALAATLLRINYGWRAKDHKGFSIDFENGEIIIAQQLENERRPRPRRLESVRLAVQSIQNLLLVRLEQAELREDPVLETTLLTP